MTTHDSDLQSTPPPGLGFWNGARFPDLVLPGVHSAEESRLFELGGDQVLLHLFASW